MTSFKLYCLCGVMLGKAELFISVSTHTHLSVAFDYNLDHISVVLNALVESNWASCS